MTGSTGCPTLEEMLRDMRQEYDIRTMFDDEFFDTKRVVYTKKD